MWHKATNWAPVDVNDNGNARFPHPEQIDAEQPINFNLWAWRKNAHYRTSARRLNGGTLPAARIDCTVMCD